jgi:hypothetical protein
MAAVRNLLGVAILLSALPAAGAQTYPLTETPQPGDCYHIDLGMTLTGKITVHKDGKPVAMKLSATGSHKLAERVLLVGPTGVPQKAARLYDTAHATITLGGDRSERSLRPECRLIVAQRPKDQLLVYSPAGPLTHEELELTAEHFDTLAVCGLLPGKAVAVGDTWKVANAVAQALCNFEGLTAQDLTCKLESVQDDLAHVSVRGTAGGIDTGALAKLKVRASYDFDLKQHRLVSLEWKQSDDREQGPASPASAVESTTTLKRTGIDQPQTLGDVALVAVPSGFDAPASLTQLVYRDPKGQYGLVYARGWQVVGATPEHLVMRLLESGDLVAQVTVTPWTAAKAGEHLSGEAFQEAMAATPGWEQESVLQAGEVLKEKGRWVYRVAAVGQMDGLKLMQNFYLVSGPGGDQVVLAFTFTEAQADKLGARDLALVNGLELSPKK